ncbi:MAG: hypothetical protein ABSE17_04505 [Candidatus Levyibacteriota bacterium]|jgi:(2Fe-2S) ferredoxin
MTSEFGEKRPDIGEQISPVPLYRDLLLRATLRDPNRAIGNDVTAVDFSGPFAETADKLNLLTQSDLEKREHGTVVYVIPSGKVLIRNEITQGDETFVSIYTEVKPNVARFFLPKAHKQDRFVGALIHSHPFDAPPSPLDLSNLLSSNKNALAHTSAFIVTPVRKILVFRGAQTPQFSQKEVEAKMNLWKKQIDERVARLRTPAMSDLEVLDMEARAQQTMVRQIIKKYGLRYFVCPVGQTIARLAPQGEL